ncbi:MAG: tyrosine-type recombinase/integrase [Polyangiales bacterium]
MGERGPNRNTDHLYKRGTIWWCWYYDLQGARVRRSTGSTDKATARRRHIEWEREATDPDAQRAQTLNDCLHTLLEDRRSVTTAVNLGYLESKLKALVTVFGHDLPTTAFRDSSRSWRYIEQRRQMLGRGGKGKVGDRTIKRELGVLRAALAFAKSKGMWSGDLDVIVPATFEPAPAPKGDAITREQAGRLFAHLTPDTAAATAFSLATGAELSGLKGALRADVPDDLTTCRSILVRGTKNEHRHAEVPIVTDEQRLLLAYARQHARGINSRLFGNLHRMRKELKDACVAEGIVVVSPHDLRRSAGQWMIDLSVPVELVSKFMRHADTRITETIYASVKREDLTDRFLDVIDTRYATAANQGRQKPVVGVLAAIPPPRLVEKLYVVEGVSKTLTEWSIVSGIAKTTLLTRITAGGQTMSDAIRKRPSGRRRAAQTPPEPAADCDTVVSVSSDSEAPNGHGEPPRKLAVRRKPRKSSEDPARHPRFERGAFGFGGPRNVAFPSRILSGVTTGFGRRCHGGHGGSRRRRMGTTRPGRAARPGRLLVARTEVVEVERIAGHILFGRHVAEGHYDAFHAGESALRRNELQPRLQEFVPTLALKGHLRIVPHKPNFDLDCGGFIP